MPNLHDRGADIHLLARKFASDFARKYMTEPIRFSPEAVHTMTLYRWPGNVRQLKNIVEQLALFDAGTEISREQMIDALPIDHSALTTPVHVQRPHDYETEQKMIWQLILSLKTEVEYLRKMVENKEETYQPGDYSVVPNVTSLMKYPDNDLLGVKNSPTSLEDAERQTIVDALARHNGDKRKAAADLNISLRTLYRKIQEYEI